MRERAKRERDSKSALWKLVLDYGGNFQVINKTLDSVVSGQFVWRLPNVSAWGGVPVVMPQERWMMDAVQQSYATSSSALMAPGRRAPAPHADLVTERWHSNSTFSLFFLYAPPYSFSLPHSQWDSWIYSRHPRWLLCGAEQSILQPTGLLCKVVHQIQMTETQGDDSRGCWSKIAHLEAC